MQQDRSDAARVVDESWQVDDRPLGKGHHAHVQLKRLALHMCENLKADVAGSSHAGTQYNKSWEGAVDREAKRRQRKSDHLPAVELRKHKARVAASGLVGVSEIALKRWLAR